MAFFDDLTKEVNKIGRDVTQKTQSFTDGMKLNNQISDQRKNLSSLYENLGRMAFQDEAVRSNEKYKNLVGMIQNGEQNLRNLEEQLSISKGEVKCKNCGAFIPKGHVFCQNCGTKIDPPMPPQNINNQNMGGGPNMNNQSMGGGPNMNGQNMGGGPNMNNQSMGGGPNMNNQNMNNS